ncbi:LTA synthase family protein [Butyrivibrio sp. AD3002]|uniref:LTA synthase family protein n=1 Tax=Butyrivibrio sp. AD3002 TaxID=1280670 RepID=UPI0003B60587|nr:LTA synthase family protein [Butyrivibrio sp. AD3002]
MCRIIKIVKRIIWILIYHIFVTLLLIGFVGDGLLSWYKETFGVTFREIIYTIKSPLKGADTHFLQNAVLSAMPAILIVIFIAVVLYIYKQFLRKQIMGDEQNEVRRTIVTVIEWGVLTSAFVASFLYALFVLGKADGVLQVSEFLEAKKHETHIYEDYYVAPDETEIISDKRMNLIHIYVESMETTYASEEVGGKQKSVNYIPNLTKLANENISFSNDDKLGGFHCSTGTGWTAVALFASETGLPFCFPIEGNEDFGNREAFAAGVVSLGDILESKGYYQEFLCGSDATFGGRRAFYEQHGGFEIFDWYEAVNKGYVSEDEFVWWGLEDKNLYKIAKDELTRMSALDKPFNLTMLTVDTHHVDGWVCDLCGNEYSEQLANVVKCADNQIYDFILWCEEQPWYDNTVIVIQGDHPRMDTSLVGDLIYYDRTVYNCFINGKCNVNNVNRYNRELLTMDLFPSILSAMGYTIPDDKLGLGTNAFSDKKTLAEELGYDYVNEETGKYSKYYIDAFS